LAGKPYDCERLSLEQCVTKLREEGQHRVLASNQKAILIQGKLAV
jgi:hypothetical protein